MRSEPTAARILPGPDHTVPSDSELRDWPERADFTAIAKNKRTRFRTRATEKGESAFTGTTECNASGESFRIAGNYGSARN